jgi:hypothetical protein
MMTPTILLYEASILLVKRIEKAEDNKLPAK